MIFEERRLSKMLCIMRYIIEYDKVADALYIRLTDAGDAKVAESEEIAPGIIVDFDERDNIVGVEILWFSKRRFNLTKLILKGPEVLVAGA